MTDYYTTLGVDRTADPETIKRAYRKLAAQHHPDRGGDTNRFQEIQAAYDTLSDPNKKAQYDNPQPQGFEFHFGQSFPGGFTNIFEQHFGPGHPFSSMFGRQTPKNRNLNLQTQITLLDAYHGKDLTANITLPSGRTETVTIKIPPGVNDGTTIRLSNLGDDTVPNIPRGDIFLTIHLEPHQEYQRNGNDLIKEIEINCIDAMLGKNIQVNTLNGSILEINVKPGTQPGQVLSVGGYGMPDINNPLVKGKLLLQVKIFVPTFLDNRNRHLLEQIKL